MNRVLSLALVVAATLAAGWPAAAATAAPPGPPDQLSVDEGSAWRADNPFTVRWNNPAETGSGIVRARYRVLANGTGTEVATGTAQLSGARNFSLSAPGPGAYTVEVRLEDSSGSIGAAATTQIRFDDERPGTVEPEAAGGWLSDDEFPYEQRVGLAEPEGPSGIAGYAVAVSAANAVHPCPLGSCSPAQISFTGAPGDQSLSIQGLAEGSHWVSAVAVSGAGLASAEPRQIRLRVDRTAPASTIHGVPPGWVREPVGLEVTATDPASGMEAKPGADDGEPVTVIRAEGKPARVFPGDSADLMVDEEGVTRVQYWARDLAGNMNDGGLTEAGNVHDAPGEALVRIDRRAPIVTINGPRDPSDPELVTAKVRDTASGPAEGTISFRKKGDTGEFTRLATAVGGDTLTARLPSDELPRGRYEIRAEATDRAGNTGVSTDLGEPLILTLPLKVATKVTIGFARTAGRADRSRMKQGVPMRIRGRVETAGGEIFAGVPVVIEQKFDPGSRRRNARRTVITDRAGRFKASLGAGPSRAVRARFGGTRTAQPATSRELEVIARDRVRFRVNPGLLVNGGAATMAGRVTGRGAPQPAGGKLVAIQYFDPSRNRWRPVEVIRADRHGKFRYRYRFRTIAYAQKILFRAVSLPEAGWPFETTASKRRPVIVYPSG